MARLGQETLWRQGLFITAQEAVKIGLMPENQQDKIAIVTLAPSRRPSKLSVLIPPKAFGKTLHLLSARPSPMRQ
jgi:hypothetical protein